jgi:hypothetical protein
VNSDARNSVVKLNEQLGWPNPTVKHIRQDRIFSPLDIHLQKINLGVPESPHNAAEPVNGQ